MTALWAVARHTIQMSIRRFVGFAIAVVLVAVGALTAWFLEGDQTLVGDLRVVLAWGFRAMSAFSMLLIVFLASTVLDREIVGRQITLLDVKPISRWQVLLGKWIGLAILSLVLTLLFGGVSYASLRWVEYRWAESAGDETERSAGAAIAEREFFSSRRSYVPEVVVTESDIDGWIDRMRAEPELRALSTDPAARAAIATWLRSHPLPIPYAAATRFVARGLPALGSLAPRAVVRHRLYARSEHESLARVAHRWSFGPQSNARPTTTIDAETNAGSEAELEFPTDSVGASGTLSFALENRTGEDGDEIPSRLFVSSTAELEVLVPTGEFEGNFGRGLALFWIRLCMLAGIGVAASTFLRGSVTAFLLTGLVVAGSLNNFVSDLVVQPEAENPVEEWLAARDQGQDEHTHDDGHGHDHAHGHAHDHGHDHGSAADGGILDSLAPLFFLALPDFVDTDPVPDLLVAREIEWRRILRQMCVDIGLRTGGVWILGLFFFYRREVGIPVLD